MSRKTTKKKTSCSNGLNHVRMYQAYVFSIRKPPILTYIYMLQFWPIYIYICEHCCISLTVIDTMNVIGLLETLFPWFAYKFLSKKKKKKKKKDHCLPHSALTSSMKFHILIFFMIPFYFKIEISTKRKQMLLLGSNGLIINFTVYHK